MSGIRYGISPNQITWEESESEIKVGNTGEISITIVGSVGVDTGMTSIKDAMDLIPKKAPSAPLGGDNSYSDAVLIDYSGRYLGDDTIQVTATYGFADPSQLQPGGNELKDPSDSDRAVRTIAVEEVPLLAHPLVKNFEKKDRVLLSCLLDGSVTVNPNYDPDGIDENSEWEFRKYDLISDSYFEAVFSDEDVTSDGITASPLDYARLIASGITVYRRPLVRHSVTRQRNKPVTNNGYDQVGEALSYTPTLAPDLTGGQWFLNGITDSTENGESWTSHLEFEYTAQGGALRAIYKGGEAEIL